MCETYDSENFLLELPICSLAYKILLNIASNFAVSSISEHNVIMRYHCLQSILNAAARIILRIPKFSHISASIRSELHWLPVRFRPEFKICLFVRNCMIGTAPAYLQELCVAVSSSAGRRNLCSASRGDLVVPRADTTRFGRRGFRANHLELPTAGISTNYEQCCWTV